MNIYWKIRTSISKRDEHCGALLKNRKNHRYPRLDLESSWFPLNKWGIGYWKNK